MKSKTLGWVAHFVKVFKIILSTGFHQKGGVDSAPWFMQLYELGSPPGSLDQLDLLNGLRYFRTSVWMTPRTMNLVNKQGNYKPSHGFISEVVLAVLRLYQTNNSIDYRGDS